MAGDTNNKIAAAPKALLSVTDGSFLMIGMVIGVGIFKVPSGVAASVSSVPAFLLAWLLGGAASLCGALVYAELSARYPQTGGEYGFLARGFGPAAGFLFGWSRMTVIQTGAIAAVAFVFGDYASQILHLGTRSAAIYAVLAVIVFTGLNVAGTRRSKNLQKTMEIALIAAMVLMSLGALLKSGAPVRVEPAPQSGTFGLAMILVLFTYGGWNEAAYLGGELRDAKRSMTRVLVVGIVAVSALYLLVNLGYLAVLGLEGMRNSSVVAADVMHVIAGDRGALLLSAVVCVSAATTLNAAIFTGARTMYALGQDFKFLRVLGDWRESGSTPANALILQGAITLALVLAGSVTPDGFSSMVAYTAPVFWTFFLAAGLTLFVFRARGGEDPAFRVPLYPVVPGAFCAMCLYMLYSSIDYAVHGSNFSTAVLAGIIVMASGIPLYLWARSRQ
ncbi:MAG: APC family permease [Betaproteobacteria bacterium]|nr:APC family permease [Betaproteobacteria bacterium]